MPFPVIEVQNTDQSTRNRKIIIRLRHSRTVLSRVINFQLSVKYTTTQLGVTGSLLPKTVRDAPPNRELNRRKKKNYRFALNSNNVDRSLIAKGIWQLFAYTCRAWRGISAAVFNCDKQVYHSLNTHQLSWG